MYADSKTIVNINGKLGKAFPVKIGVHQCSLLSPLLFIIVKEALPRRFRKGLPLELLYADDLLVLITEGLEELDAMFSLWKNGMEQKSLRAAHANVVASKVNYLKQKISDEKVALLI